MGSETAGWTRFIRPGFRLEFSYPDPTPEGQVVVLDEQPFRGYARVHLSTRDRPELYLEVLRFHDLTPQAEYEQHKPHLERRFGVDSVSPLIETTLQDWPAHAYHFDWNDEEGSGERTVVLLQIAGETYRIITDPRSELNARVIATINPAE